MKNEKSDNHNSDVGVKKRKNLVVIKIGGNIIDDEERLSSFLKDFALLNPPDHGIGTESLLPPAAKILVHGGGKLASNLAKQLAIPQQIIEGRRITDAETLKVVTMIYAGYINKNIVAQLQGLNCNSVGLTGADGNLVQAHKRNHPTIDYGFVGDIDIINIELLKILLEQNITVVVAPITHDKKGQLLNTNADTIAQEIAKGLSNLYEVTLIYSFEKNGVLENAADDNTVFEKINSKIYQDLKQRGAIFGGMIPKLDNAFAALKSGVKKVIIGKAENIHQLINGEAGTALIK
jgi:acetylglutamate kinase